MVMTLAELVEPADWMDGAICRQVDPDLWFPEKGGSTTEAKAVCAGSRRPLRVPRLCPRARRGVRHLGRPVRHRTRPARRPSPLPPRDRRRSARPLVPALPPHWPYRPRPSRPHTHVPPEDHREDLSMTSTLPPFGDQEVHKAAIKMTGAGTGLSEGIKVKPLVLDIGETAYFVIEARCAGVEHTEDKDEMITRVHKLHTENMAPISEEIAQQALLAYTREVEAAKADSDGQEPLFRDDDTSFQGRSGVHPVERSADEPSDEEQAALDAEELDETGTPGEVAEAALARVITPSFSNPAAND